MAAPAVNATRSTPAIPRTPVAKPKTTQAAKPRTQAAAPRAPSAAVVASSIAAIGLAVIAAEEQIAMTEEVKPEATLETNGHSTGALEYEPEVEAVKDTSEEVKTSAKEEEQEEEANSDEHVASPPSPGPETEEFEQVLGSDPDTAEGANSLPAEQGSGDDLEDIVNLLESVTITKPYADTTADIPDELLEIPDEEEK